MTSCSEPSRKEEQGLGKQLVGRARAKQVLNHLESNSQSILKNKNVPSSTSTLWVKGQKTFSVKDQARQQIFLLCCHVVAVKSISCVVLAKEFQVLYK